MSSASTIGLPFFKSSFISPPVITDGTLFNYTLTNYFNIPAGNYIAWVYLTIRGNVDTALGPVISVINNGSIAYPFTVNPSPIDLNAQTVAYQNTQIVSINTNQPIFLQGQINFENTAPNVVGVIFFYPI
jgi:hypothetical protein